jgi:hypothetical protein
MDGYVGRDETLRERYTSNIPVIFIRSRKVAKHKLDAAEFRRQLERA